MPGLTQRNDHYYSSSSSASGFWSKDIDGICYNQLHKFWDELSPKARKELLRIDKQALFEQARKNMCCSRCNGLLLECFLQIVSYGKSLGRKGSIGNLPCNGSGASKGQAECKSVVNNRCKDELQDPSIHQWGGLTTTHDGSLTFLDCYLYVKSFLGLQTVFESARARERERELLYPDACGGDGRVWITQGIAGYGKGHGTRETCALHTTRLSCDTLVDFWSVLEEESRHSLLRMKEEDFMERLTYRFDCKKFCRDCRRNVIREFKELKELKRIQREPRCTDWFCVADTAFQYQVDIDSVRADWSQYFSESAGYHQFEWAIGTGEGESDILEFKFVGKERSARATGLDLCGLHECYITLRAFRKNGRSSLISVKAHALRGQQCVHSRLVVGDGFVSMKRGECIRMFFEHAEEAEEEEDEVMIDQDGNELDGECLLPQKHAKSPELAREFLLDAATVIFKEQVEKAFREGTARQNAHSIFVCLASKLLEQRVHIACKEIITLEKQNKLLEEEEKEEERKERKRTKDREKKLRRKERLKEKVREKEMKNPIFSDKAMVPREEESSLSLDEETNNTIACEESGNEIGDVDLSSPGSPDDQDGECLDDCTSPRAETDNCGSTNREIIYHEDENGCLMNDNPRPIHQRARFWKELQPGHALKWSEKRRHPCHVEPRYCNDRLEVSSRNINLSTKNFRVKALKAGNSPNSMKSQEGLQCSDNKIVERYGYHSCGRKPINGYWEKVSATRSVSEPETMIKSDSDLDVCKPVNQPDTYTQTESMRELRPNSKVANSQNPSLMDSSELKHPRNISNCDDDSSAVKLDDTPSPCKATEKLDKKMEVHITPKKDPVMSRTSSSENCSSCLSEGDSNTASNNGNTESSSVSDSEDTSLQSERKDGLVDTQTDIPDCHEKMTETKGIDESDVLKIKSMLNLPSDNGQSKLPGTPFTVHSQNMVQPNVNTGSYMTQPQSMLFPQMLNQSIPMSVFQAAPSTMGYYHEPQVSWSAGNGLTTFPHPLNHYVYTGPLGYSLNGESPLCMQYGTPLNYSATTPFYNTGPVPVFHPFPETKTVNIVDQAQCLKQPLSPVETPSSEENFSLFHSGGPVALCTGRKSKLAHSKDEVSKDLSSQFIGDHVFDDLKGNNNKVKKESIVGGEEYNLFATSNSFKFSIS
ncbi:unnamed protein product [Cochlearia groenlandica]